LFLQNFEEYEKICITSQNLDGKAMQDPFGEQRGSFKYGSILSRLRSIKLTLDNKRCQVAKISSPDNTIDKSKMELEKKIDSQLEKKIDSTLEKDSEPMETDHSLLDMETEKAISNPTSPPPISTEKTIDLDEEMARKLQEAEYISYKSNSIHNSPDYSKNYNSYNYQNSQIPSFTPVKPPSMSELKKENTEPKDRDYDPEIVCLICHQSPKEYIVLPNCQQPHIYCMTCAHKMINSKNTNSPFRGRRRSPLHNNRGSIIQCVLCSAISNLDPVGGLTSLRRRKRKKTEDKRDKCREHNEDYCFFCMDDSELLCFMCASKHSRHNLEAFDIAQKQVSISLSKQLETLEQKKKKLGSFLEVVKTKQDTINTISESTLKDVKEKITSIRKLLDEKEKELEDSIKRTSLSKKHTVESEIRKTQDRIKKIDESIFLVSEAMVSKTPLEFLLKVEEVEEVARHISMVADPEVKNKWFEMPIFHPQLVEQTIKELQYPDKRNPGIYGLEYIEDEEESNSSFEEY